MTVQAPAVTTAIDGTAACPFCGAATIAGRAACATCGQPGTPLEPGTLLHGAYTVLETFSTSATGAVYRAQYKRRNREVAIKELIAPVGGNAQDRAALKSRFTRLARQVAALKHPCLPEVYESFAQDGRLYLVMGLLPGQSLGQILASHGQGYGEGAVRGWGESLLALLDYQQAQHPPFVHGEIVPAHVMIRADGTPCLIGFGLSWRLGLRPRTLLPGTIAVDTTGPSTTTRLLGRGKSKGQILDQPTLSDDLFGLGATLHAMLTGHDVATSDLLSFPPVRDLAPRVSVGFAEAINRAVSSDPRLRLPTTEAFRQALSPGQAGMPSRIAAAPGARRNARGGRATGLAILLAAMAVIAAVAAYAMNNRGGNQSAAAPSDANPQAARPVPAVARTTTIADTFVRVSSAWVTDGQDAFQRNDELWLSNLEGSRALKVTRGTYVTGPDGFVLRATLHLTSGSASTTYGLVAADRTGSRWENVALLVRADGHWTLLHYTGGHAPPLVGWREDGAVRRGHNTPNELQLSLTPRGGSRSGTFAVSINGRKVAKGVAAWAGTPGGRVGIVAGPGAEIAADTFSVRPPARSKTTVEDHFLDTRLGWVPPTAGGAVGLLSGGMLHVRPLAGLAWRQATPGALRIGTLTTPLTTELTFSLNAPASHVAAAGGLIFAAPADGTTSPSLAALIDLKGAVSIVALSPGRVRTLAGPVVGTPARTGKGLNVLSVRLSPGAGGPRAQVSVNGVQVIAYPAVGAGLRPTVGIVAVGNSGVDASALRIGGRAAHLQ